MYCIGSRSCFVLVLSFNLLNVLIWFMANEMKNMFITFMDDIKVGRPGTILEDSTKIWNELGEKVRYNSILKNLLWGMYNQLHKDKVKKKIIYRKGSAGYSRCKLHESLKYLLLQTNIDLLGCINHVC